MIHMWGDLQPLPERYRNFFGIDLSSPYTNEYGYCNDPFCDIEEGHKHGPLCHMICICKGNASDGSQ